MLCYLFVYVISEKACGLIEMVIYFIFLSIVFSYQTPPESNRLKPPVSITEYCSKSGCHLTKKVQSRNFQNRILLLPTKPNEIF